MKGVCCSEWQWRCGRPRDCWCAWTDFCWPPPPFIFSWSLICDKFSLTIVRRSQPDMGKPKFDIHWGDYTVFCVTTSISLSIGIYHALSGSGQKTTDKYLVGNRTMRVAPVALSLVVTYMSSVFLLGNPAEAFIYGFPGIAGFFTVLVANSLSAWITVPLFHPLKITSSYEVRWQYL